MNLVTDLFMWLIIDTILGFFLYSTGCFALKLITFGRFEAEFKDFASFKTAKSKKVTSIIFVGISFYSGLIAIFTTLN